MKLGIIGMLLTSWLAAAPATPDIGRHAALFIGEWTNGKHTLKIIPDGHDRITVSGNRFTSEATVRGDNVMLPDHLYGRPTDDLTGVCVLELQLKKETLEIVASGQKEDCDAFSGGTYRRVATKPEKKK